MFTWRLMVPLPVRSSAGMLPGWPTKFHMIALATRFNPCDEFVAFAGTVRRVLPPRAARIDQHGAAPHSRNPKAKIFKRGSRSKAEAKGGHFRSGRRTGAR